MTKEPELHRAGENPDDTFLCSGDELHITIGKNLCLTLRPVSFESDTIIGWRVTECYTGQVVLWGPNIYNSLGSVFLDMKAIKMYNDGDNWLFCRRRAVAVAVLTVLEVGRTLKGLALREEAITEVREKLNACNRILLSDDVYRIEHNPNCAMSRGNGFLIVNDSGQCSGGYTRDINGRWTAEICIKPDVDDDSDVLPLGEFDTLPEAVACLWKHRFSGVIF